MDVRTLQDNHDLFKENDVQKYEDDILDDIENFQKANTGIVREESKEELYKQQIQKTRTAVEQIQDSN